MGFSLYLHSLTAQRVTKCGVTPKNVRAARSFIEIPFSLEYQTLNLRVVGLSPTLDEVLFAGIPLLCACAQ